jgi:DNA recombination protein RmuC
MANVHHRAMSLTEIALLVLTLLGFAAVIALLLRRGGGTADGGELRARLDAMEQSLGSAFAKSTADTAARLEQVKGDLRTELSDRLQSGLHGVRETVEQQLVAGRNEQAQRLAESRTELAQGLTQLSSKLESKFEQLSESQAVAASRARAELGQSLESSTKTLQQRFEGLEHKTAQNLEAIRGKVDEKLTLISDQVQAKLEKNIQEGFAHFKAVQEHLKAAEEQLRNVGVVGESINQLNTLLKLPHLRGKFGEAELGRLLADFLPASAYEEQAVIVPGSREMADAVVKFPRYRLPIDSKFNREQILPLFETNDPAKLDEARVQLATVVKAQAKSIAEKYIHPEHGTTDLALMFLPSETLYFEVIRNGELLAAIHRLKVFPVSPNTLAIALRSVEMSISQYEFAKGVQKTIEQIRAAQKSFGFFQGKFEEVGKGLRRAQEAYETASGHLNRYADRVVRVTGEEPPELEGSNGDGPTSAPPV